MRIILLGRAAAVGRRIIQELLQCDSEILEIRNASEAAAHLDWFDTAEVIVGGPITAEIVAHARRLKLVQAPHAGLDRMGLEHLAPGVLVANTFHHEVSLAEHVLMAMLMLLRRPLAQDQALRQGRWEGAWMWGESPRIQVLAGTTVLLLGLGHIARAILDRARAFQMHPVVVSRRPDRSDPSADRIVGYAHWREEIPAADFLVPCCPLTESTRGLIGAQELARMKSSAFLINVARGEIVDEQALYEALRGGAIAGAALDVWYQYPRSPEERCLPSRFPFHELPNVLMTPHGAGWTRQTIEGRARDIAANIDRLAAGLPLYNLVTVR